MSTKDPGKYLRQHGKDFEVVDGNPRDFPEEILIPIHNDPTDRQREILSEYGHEIIED